MRTLTLNRFVGPDGASLPQVAYLLCVALRIAIGSMFAIAGLSKIVYEDEFIRTLISQELLPAVTINVVAIALPHLEIVLGLMLAFGVKLRATTKMIIALLLLFSMVSAIAFIQGRVVDCGCFPMAGANEPVGLSLFVRNALLVLSCLFILTMSAKQGGAKEMVLRAN